MHIAPSGFILACLLAASLTTGSEDNFNRANQHHSPLSHSPPQVDSGRHNYSKFCAKGLYSLRVAIPHHATTDQVDNDDYNTESLQLYSFRKVYDASKKRLRVDVYPVNVPELSSKDNPLFSHHHLYDKASDYDDDNDDDVEGYHRHPGAAIMILEDDHLYLISEKAASSGEEEEGETNVKCRLWRMKWREMDLLKGARYESLMFEHNHLCNKYTGLNIHRGWHREDDLIGQCTIDYSSIYLDAFTNHPVELFVEGRIPRRRQLRKQAQYDFLADKEEIMTHEIKFWIASFIRKFEIGMSAKKENDLFRLPESLKKTCREGGDIMDGYEDNEDKDADDFESHFMAILQRLIIAME